jgi:hypothetical protein
VQSYHPVSQMRQYIIEEQNIEVESQEWQACAEGQELIDAQESLTSKPNLLHAIRQREKQMNS